jgi:tetratricopeptide (TPR) repeat protein
MNRFLLMMLLTLSWIFPPYTLAEPVKNVRLPASRHDLLEEWTVMKYIIPFTIAVLRGDSTECSASGPLPLAERNRLRECNILSVNAAGAADQFLFDDIDLFRGLQSAAISSEAYNETYLKSLALHNPDITSLVISQTRPLGANALNNLRMFKKLRYLEIDCPLESPGLLLFVLPARIEQLQIADRCSLPTLPHLIDLRINRCRLDPDFFNTLKAPHLVFLQLHNVDVPVGSFRNISRFLRLRNINVDNSNIDKTELNYFQSLKYAETVIRSEEQYYASFQAKAEKSFSDYSYADAIQCYTEVAFAEPSVDDYLQLAKCYIRLGCATRAMRYCDYAASIDPTCAKIIAVRSEATAVIAGSLLRE